MAYQKLKIAGNCGTVEELEISERSNLLKVKNEIFEKNLSIKTTGKLSGNLKKSKNSMVRPNFSHSGLS